MIAKYSKVIKLYLKMFFKNLSISVATLIFSILFATMSMICVYAIPTESVEYNVESSLDIYKRELDWFMWSPPLLLSQLDNYTDALMLSLALYSEPDNPPTFKDIVHNSMQNPMYEHTNSYTTVASLIKYYEEPDRTKIYRTEYSLYWHGYLIFLKPLLTVFTMSDIRILNMFMQLIVLYLLLIKLYSRGGV